MTTTTLIPANEAAHIFVRKAGAAEGDYATAAAYLPKAFDRCAKCDVFEEHDHPGKPAYTEAEIDRAVAEFFTDAFCAARNC